MSDEGLDRRIALAGAELRRALNPTPPDLTGIAMRRRRRRRAVVLLATATLLAVAGVAVVARDSDENADVVAGPGSTLPPGTPSPSTSPSTPSTLSTLPPGPTPGSGLQSEVVPIGGVATVLVTSPNRIDVLEWSSGWRTAASFDVPGPGVLRQSERERPLVVRDVTGDDEPDFLVPLEAASTAAYQVISNHDAAWRQVPFGSADRITVTEPDAPTADRFVTSFNLCQPTCADGRYRRELWRYAPADGRFVLVESAVCDGVAPGEWRCDPAGSSLATGQPIGSG